MISFSAIVEIIIDQPIEQAFLGIVPIELSKVFTGYGPLPAVSGVSDQVGGWDAEGQTRTVLLSDGSSANERITEYQYPEYFSYTVSRFTGIFRFVTTSANGEWWFEPLSEKQTHVKWRYTYNSRSAVVAPLLWFIVNVFWRGYMNKSLTLTKHYIESNDA